MQQVATQLGMFSPIALQFGAYSAYTQAVSTDPWVLGLAHPRLLLASRTCPHPSSAKAQGWEGNQAGHRGPGPTLLSSPSPS